MSPGSLDAASEWQEGEEITVQERRRADADADLAGDSQTEVSANDSAQDREPADSDLLTSEDASEAEVEPSGQNIESLDEQADDLDDAREAVDKAYADQRTLPESRESMPPRATEAEQVANPVAISDAQTTPGLSDDAEAEARAQVADVDSNSAVDRESSARQQVESALQNDSNDRIYDNAELGRAELAEAPILDIDQVNNGNANDVYRAQLADGQTAYLKPASGEAFGLRPDGIPFGTEWQREIAACDVDRALGLGLVPDTVERSDTDLGVGSLQEEAPEPPKPYSTYSQHDQQAMATLDYALANTDRHDENYRTSADGRPAAIDNGLCLPESDAEGVRSQWVADQLGKPLDADIVERFQHLDLDVLSSRLRADGIGEAAIIGFRDRVEEIRSGVITGSAWRGAIYDGSASWHIVRARL